MQLNQVRGHVEFLSDSYSEDSVPTSRLVEEIGYCVKVSVASRANLSLMVLFHSGNGSR